MEDKQITLQIDHHFVTVQEGTTILEAAQQIGIDIPTLCHIDLKGTCIKNTPASCRICVVEVEGRRNLAPACATKCTEGMVVRTSTLRVMNARKIVAELILSDHPNECLTCPKAGNCDLQNLALRFNIREMPFNGGELSPRKREVTASIVRNMDKCIFCRRCETVCNEVQTVGALGAIRRGFNTTIAPAFDKMMTESECTYCGQCVAVCPVGALTERDHTNRLVEDLADPDKVVIVQTAPAVRAAIGEEFGMQPGTLVTGKMVAALRELGFDYVFDTDFAADLTIMEEGAEMLNRLTRYLDGDRSVRLPILTSCCPAWVNFFEHQFPDLLDIPSTARSPQQMFGSIAKNWWAEKMGIPPSIAGVTFLSFGNGGPDVFALMSAVVSGYSHIGMGSNLGAGLFITTVITGVVAFMSECRVNPLSFFRDLITYIVRVLRRGSRAGVDDLFGSCVFRREGPRVGSRGLLRHLLRLRRRGHHLPKAVRGGLRGRCRSGGRT